MPRYRKKPVEVEARRVVPASEYESIVDYVDDSIKLAAWCGGLSHMMAQDDEPPYEGCDIIGPHIWITDPTNEGDHAAMPGDYIVKGVEGEFYGCKPNIFHKTYDHIPEGD